MNAEQILTYLQALAASVTINVIVPLVILAAMMVAVWRLIMFAQRKPDFNIEGIFLDDDRKASCARFLMLLAFAYSCWHLAVGRLTNTLQPWEFPAFLAAFANSLTLIKMAERWNGVLPFAKSPPTDQPPGS